MKNQQYKNIKLFFNFPLFALILLGYFVPCYSAEVIVKCTNQVQDNCYIISSKYQGAYDGDTVYVDLPSKNIKAQSIRIVGIDAPEIHGKNQCEKDLARKAKNFTISYIKKADVNLVLTGQLSYKRGGVPDGRLIGNFCDLKGCLSDELIKNNLAKVYNYKERHSSYGYNWGC